MQTPTLPILSAGASASPNAAPRPKNGGESGDGQFSQTLSREVGQRQQQEKPAAPTQAAAKPATPTKAREAQSGEKNTAAKSSSSEPARAAGAKTETADAAAEDAAAQAAAAGNPALDMLALVASLNLPVAPPASAAPAADVLPEGPTATAATLQAGVAVALPQASTLPGAPVEGAAAPEGTLTNMMAVADGSVLDAIKKPETTDGGHPLGQAVQRLATEPAETKPRAGLAAADLAPGQPKGAPEASQFATALRAREAAPEPAALRDLQPVAPTTSPVQQASLALAQAANVGANDKIAARVGTPGWDNQIGQKIVWMVAGKEQSASLTLNPPDMGPMQVVLSVTNDHANVTFSAAQPEVRQALEDAMPKLREMMSESGIALGNASVNDGSAQQQAQAQADARQNGSNGRLGGAGLTNGSAAEAEAAQAARPRRVGETQGLVDTFA
jgi:flagellar hook-length control protein FliK